MKQVIEGKIENEDGADIAEEVDAILDADFELPIEPRERFKINQKATNVAYKYYLKIQPELKDWWDEFNTALDDKGNHQYRSVYQFAKAKGKTKLEQDYIFEMIGPRPELKEGRQLRVPWLGDWLLRRSNGFWSPNNPKQIQSLAQALKHKMVNWDAVRSSAPYLAQLFARQMKMGELVDKAFRGEMFDPDLKTTDPENLARARLYLEFQAIVTEKGLKLMDKWMEIHGVDPKNPVQMIQNNTLAQFNGSPLGLMDGQDQLTPAMRDLEALRLAKQLKAHATNYKMPLPEVLTPPKETIPVQKEQPNGKSKVQ